MLDAPEDPQRDVVIPRYDDDRGQNPVLIRRGAFDLIDETRGDRGLGPVLAAHPDRLIRIPLDGANPDVDTRDDLARLAETAWGDRVRANREQVDRVREVPDGTDFYAPVRSIFRADPTRTDDPVLARLLDIVRPGDRWLDVGAGAGRFALPLARSLAASGGSVVAVDASASMLESAREIAHDYDIRNITTIHTRWPPDDAGALAMLASDVVLIAHVGYDIEAIGPFVAALEAAARRELVAVLMDQMPASAADAFWPPVHGEERVRLPALSAFVELLTDRGRDPIVERITRRAPTIRVARGARKLRPAPTVDRPDRAEGGALPGRAGRAGRAGRRRLDDQGSRTRRHRRRALGGEVIDEAVAPDGRPMVHPPDRGAWRAWLAANHTRPDGVWVVMDRRGTNPTQVDYEASVEEALCFGWIDSKVVKLDAERTLQWFSPRRPRGTWARTNKVRVERLTAAGLMTPAGLAVIEDAKRNGTWTLLDDVEELVVPEDLAAAFAAAPTARANWDAFSRSARRAILVWIAQAVRPETRAARVAETARRAAVNEKANEPRSKD